jgi:hypothetical protein
LRDHELVLRVRAEGRGADRGDDEDGVGGESQAGSVAEPSGPDRGVVGRVCYELCLVGGADSEERVGATVCGGSGEQSNARGEGSGETILEFDPLDPSVAPIAPKTLVANYVFASLAGVIWYFQFFFYSMGQTKMGKYDFSSWTLHMASIIIFATLWGLALKEWKGTSRRTKLLVATGLFLAGELDDRGGIWELFEGEGNCGACAGSSGMAKRYSMQGGCQNDEDVINSVVAAMDYCDDGALSKCQSLRPSS